ncbi:PHP domain-like protein [Athelia psychrophila]|uniref:PHP domain-like protein n=1 Tax=Athelia psychrophila TaxID=1759441 RepID=A0A166Q5D6_9AGAM|nr:PHP domain-like protein [Fibularhizoctonia sp. CBS 109695]
MYFDLNVPTPNANAGPNPNASKKGKGKQLQTPPDVSFSPAQIATLEARLDLLVHLGYTVVALNQTIHKKIDPKAHVDTLGPLLEKLRKRQGILFLKRLTIVLDEDSEKGFGLTNGNVNLVQPYDILSLLPTTATTFSLACLTHTVPSQLTAHIITLPLTLPRLPFHLKHTLVRTAIKNGAVFEICYAGALGGDGDALIGSEGGASAKRNWWAAAREVVRITKGKGIVVSGGVNSETDYRAPRDIGNIISLLGLAQNLAHDASTTIPKSLVLRAQTRKTYRAVLSEPRVVIPPEYITAAAEVAPTSTPQLGASPASSTGQKRPRDEAFGPAGTEASLSKETPGEGARKKKKKKQD